MSDVSDLGAILDGGNAPAHEAPAMAPVEQRQEPTPGDKPQAAEPPAAASQPAPEPDHIPRSALLDERRKRQELERQLNEFQQRMQQAQQPQQKPDWFTDPDTAATYMQQEFAKRDFQTRVEVFEEIIAAKHPDYEQVREVFAEAALKAPALMDQLLSSRNPPKFAYEMGKRIMLANEIGGDPDAYRTKLEAEFRKKYGIQEESVGGQATPAPAAPQQRSAAPVPKSLAREASAPPRNRDQSGRFAANGPTPLEDILG